MIPIRDRTYVEKRWKLSNPAIIILFSVMNYPEN